MSAQYKPYRDEESVDGLETTSWTDTEPGMIQIYEKTTEELPFNSTNKRAFYTQIALLVVVGTLGFLLGFFGPFHQTEFHQLTNASQSQLSQNSNPLEDTTIKDKLLEEINATNILNLLNQYKDTERTPGSDSDHEFAVKIFKSFESFGLDPVTATNFSFKTYLPKRPSVVRLMSKNNSTIYSNIRDEIYPHDDMRPFSPLSQAPESTISTDQILYLNQGSKEDYERLTTLGVSQNETLNKVFVIRQTFHQVHDVVITAQESGAKAILLFPDPELYAEGSPFPKSVHLPDDAGKSHPLAWSNYGDIASFNSSSIVGIDASKLGLEKESKVHIPVILISYKTAQKILRGLSGAEAPREWNCFEFTLHIGPSYKEKNNEEDARSHIEIEFHNEERLITPPTITGIIQGSVEPDRYVIIGSRRDSLNRGSLDSVSGTAVMIEIARVFGLLVRNGWRPRRTIIFNSFGAETLNLISSSSWLEDNQRILHSRAVAFVNCDLVVIGNQTVAISASPLLYQVVFNATQQIPNPNHQVLSPYEKTVYDSWLATSKKQRVNHRKDVKRDTSSVDETPDEPDDELGSKGKFLSEYSKSASVETRPRFRRLDLHSIYSPFFLYAGIPVVDVRYAGFAGSNYHPLTYDTFPLLGTKYDNLGAVQLVDPHLKYHRAIAQTLSEILRDLSDSLYLPFNLLDYAVALNDSYTHFAVNYAKTFEESKIDIEPLKIVIEGFRKSAENFHRRQDLSDPADAIKVRRINDQLMLLERAFLDPHGQPSQGERKHIILSPNDGQEHNQGFPGLVDWISMLDENLDPLDQSIIVEILKIHFKALCYTITNAIKIIDEVYIL